MPVTMELNFPQVTVYQQCLLFFSLDVHNYIPADILRHFRAWTGTSAPLQNLETETESWLREQTRRLEMIQKVCYEVREAAEVDPPDLRYRMKHMVLDRHDQVLFCPSIDEKNPSSWRKVLARYASRALRLEQYARGDVHWEEAVDKNAIIRRQHDHVLNTREAPNLTAPAPFGQHTKKPAEPAINASDALKILLVEHPFERLLSFYLETFHKRNGLLGQRVMEKVQDMHFKKIPLEQRRQRVVTFKMFLKYVVFRFARDPHLHAIYYVCHPCDINYDYVIKMETFHRDVNNIFLKIHERNGGDPNDEIMNTPFMPASRYFSYFNLTDETWIREMLYQQYRDLETDHLLQAYDLFSIDIFLFNYSWPFQKLSLLN